MSRSEINLYNIFKGITPYAIQEIPLVKTAMKIFANNLEKNAQVSKRISAIFDYDINSSDSKHLKKCKKTLKKGLFMMYIGTLYSAINSMSHDKRIQKTLTKFQYTSAGIYNDVVDIVNNEFFASYRAFSQLVGTKRAIHYLYTFAKYLETGAYDDDLTIEEKAPFLVHYEGSLQKDIFDKIVYNLVHPLGWCYSYVSMMSEVIRDYYGISTIYNIIKLELVNSKDGRYIVFTDNSIEEVLNDFKTRLNPLTNKVFTEDDFNRQVTVYSPKYLQDYTHWTDTNGAIQKLFTFKDDTVLYYDGSTRTYTYGTYLDYLSGFTNPIGVYGSKYQLASKLDSDVVFEYYDDFEQIYKEFEVTKVREYPQTGAGDTLIKRYSADEMFKVQGNEMQFAQGLDEGHLTFEKSGENTGFDVQVVKVNEDDENLDGEIQLSDSKFTQDTIVQSIEKSGDSTKTSYYFNTEDYHGTWLTAEYTYNDVKYYFSSNILNNQKNIFVDELILEPVSYQKNTFGFYTDEGIFYPFGQGNFKSKDYDNSIAYHVKVKGHVTNVHTEASSELPKQFQNTLPSNSRYARTFYKYNENTFGFKTSDSAWKNFNQSTFAKFDVPVEPWNTDETSELTDVQNVYVSLTMGESHTSETVTKVDAETKTFETTYMFLPEVEAGEFEISVKYGLAPSEEDNLDYKGDHLFILDDCPIKLPNFGVQTRDTRTVTEYTKEQGAKLPELWHQDWIEISQDTDISDEFKYPPKRLKFTEEVVYNSDDKTDFTIVKHTYMRTSDMIGELYNLDTLTFAEPDKWTADYIDSTNPLKFKDFTFKKTGCIIEGNDYNLSADDYYYETCFVNKGYYKQYLNTTDYYFADEPGTVDDEVTFVNIGQSGFYLVSSQGYYLYTKDGCYFYTSDMNYNSISVSLNDGD